MGKNIISKICIILGLLIIFITISYSSFENNFNLSDFLAEIRVEKDIRITGINIDSTTNNAVSNYEEYTHNSLLLGMKLPNSSSTIKYKVSITNIESTEMGIYEITGLPDYLTLEIDEYDLQDKICDNEGQCSLGITKDIYLTIKYKDEASVTTENISLELLFDFRQMYSIEYINIENNGYPNYIIDNGNFEVNFLNDIPSILDVYIDDLLVDETNYSYENNKLILSNVSGNVKIVKAYNISYDLAGGTISTINPTRYNKITENITLNNPSKVGYTFIGWTGSNGETPEISLTIQKGSSGDKNYIANWRTNTYTIKYDPNGGSGSMEDTVVTYGVGATTRENTFTKDAHSFDGWHVYNQSSGKWLYKTSTGSIMWYTEGSQPEGATLQKYNTTFTSATLTSIDNCIIIFYAQWKEIPFEAYITVTYPSGTCTVSLGTEIYTHTGGGTTSFTVKTKGNWSIKAVNGSASASSSANITTSGQTLSKTLKYEFYIFKAGTGLASGYSAIKVDNTAVNAPKISTSSITFKGNSSSGGTVFVLDPAINVTPYTKLYVDVELKYSWGGNYSSAFGVHTSKSLTTMVSTNSWTAYTHISQRILSPIDRQTVSVDLTNVSGNVYFKASCVYSSGTIYNIWLSS